MQTLGILHISDLHCKIDEQANIIGEVKDKSVSNDLLNEVIYRGCPNLFFSQVQDLLRNDQVDIIACTGDLGVGKSENTLRIGAEYLAKLADRLGIKRKRVIIAPGNHDLNRKANKGKELLMFSEACRKQKFTYAEWRTPKCLNVKGIPILAINTCLGGTEHALHGVPEEFWITARKAIEMMEALSVKDDLDLPAELKLQMQALDIPAVGKSQLEKISNNLLKAKGNCVVTLAHHSLLPSSNLEVRPYSNLIDGGLLLYRLMEAGRRILFLHGHTHCDSALAVYSPMVESSGFTAAIGALGLHGFNSASVSHIHLIIDEIGNFLAASVSFFVKQGSVFMRYRNFNIWDIPHETIQDKLILDKLPPNEKITFSNVARKLSVPADNSLAETLMRFSTRKQLKIDGIKNSPEKWMIARIG